MSSQQFEECGQAITPTPTPDTRKRKNGVEETTLEEEWNNLFQRAVEEAMLKKRSELTETKKQQEVVKPKDRKKPKRRRRRRRIEVIEEEDNDPVIEPVMGEDEDEDEDEEFRPEEEEDTGDSDDDEEILQNMLGRAALMLIGGVNGSGGDQIWKQNLTEDEVKRYKWIFDKLEDMQMDIPKILRSNLTDQEKERAIYVMLNFPNQSATYEDMARLIIKRRQNPIPKEQLEHYEKLERQLTETSRDKQQMKFKVLDLQMPLEYKRIVWNEFEQLQLLEAGQSDYHKKFEWLQWILRMPWNKFQSTPVFHSSQQLRQSLIQLRQELDRHVHGLEHIKEELVLFSMNRFVPAYLPNANIDGQPLEQAQASLNHAGGRILAIEGSPGVGKTHLIKTLAKCWGQAFVGIAAGGCKDSSFWEGHGRTYEGAIPGRIVQALRQVEVMDPWIYIDEVDKLSDHEHSKDVSGILLHILDETQNSEFFDKYLGDVPLDLSHVLWVLSINDRNAIPPVLRDRLYIVKVPDPTLKDKIATMQTISIPEIIKVNGLHPDEINFTDEALRHLVTTKTSEEKGMRRLKQLVQAVVKRVAFLKHTLIQLPTSAVYHAANVAAITSMRTGKPLLMPEIGSSVLSEEEKNNFAKQTSYYWPEFKLPLTITSNVIDQILKHYTVDDIFDYRKSGWIT